MDNEIRDEAWMAEQLLLGNSCQNCFHKCKIKTICAKYGSQIILLDLLYGNMFKNMKRGGSL